ILDGIPLSVQRRFPELENRHVDFLKRDIIKAMNKAAALDELIEFHRQLRPAPHCVLHSFL
ncbi:DNA-packaging protein, partial [Escherichia coli]